MVYIYVINTIIVVFVLSAEMHIYIYRLIDVIRLYMASNPGYDVETRGRDNIQISTKHVTNVNAKT